MNAQGIYPQRDDNFSFKALKLAKSKGYLFDYEVLAVSIVARMLPENAVCVNIGAGEGTSCMAVIEARPDLVPTFYSIDISPGDNPFGGLINEKKNFKEYGVPLPNQILGDSSIVAETWDKKLDYLFIDGDHQWDGVVKDIVNWTKFMKHGGYVLFHDYNHAVWGDVKKACDKYMKDFNFVGAVDITGIFRKP